MRLYTLAAFFFALALAQFRDPSAQLQLSAGGPARVYLLKDGRPFRLSPVDAMLPLRVDLYYRERLWTRAPQPKTLEITANDESHFILLEGSATFSLPPGRYRVEAYRGFSYAPAAQDFELKPGETRRIGLSLAPVPGAGQWLSGDDHIHITRDRADDPVFVRWLQAEDLSVGNFLQLQRQADAAVQYAFGPAGEARLPGYVIRPGQESRSDFYGHINLLGARELIRPLSVGLVYANDPEPYPFPAVMFRRGRELGATTGYAHFDGSQKHSALLMDLALGTIDFIEVFQFGELKTEPWYRLLNAGLRVTGIAGSDFPVPLGRRKPWPRSIPLLGPERTLVRAKPGAPLYETWAAGVRAGEVVVSNGPLLNLTVNGRGPGATIPWDGDAFEVSGEVTSTYHRPIEAVEVVVNGQVVSAGPGAFRIKLKESSWIAARARAAKLADEPEIRAHTNPVYVLRGGRPVRIAADRDAVRKQWEEQAAWYRSGALPFTTEARRKELVEGLERASEALRR